MENPDTHAPPPRPRVIVKFRDEVDLPYEDGVEQLFEELHIGPWEKLSTEFPGITFKKMFSLDQGIIQGLVEQASQTDPTYDPPNLLTLFVVDYPQDLNPWALVQALSAWDTVQTAYVEPPAKSPQCEPDPRPPDPARQCVIGNRIVTRGGHLNPAPDGVDALYAWDFAGGAGQGQRLIDMELGWTLEHEALVDAGGTPRASLLRPDLFEIFIPERDHGTQVIGVIVPHHSRPGCGGPSSVIPCDCRGIAPCTAVDVFSYRTLAGDQNRPDALLLSLNDLSFGDVLLIEAETECPEGVPPSESWLCQGRPIEIFLADYLMIRLATALGIVVVETAGNSGGDLAALQEDGRSTGTPGILDPSSPDFRDSGAIMVGAATAAAPHVPIVSNTGNRTGNYGARIDCYAWGECVYTSTSSRSATPTTTDYTQHFDGTSSAGAIIAGVALVVQSLAEANLHYRLSPWQLRAILRDVNNGTSSLNGSADQIGVMPDLRSIIQSNVLNLTPDIYIRDYVCDTGDPHTGPISASPDIILRTVEEPDPQASFGQGSGTEYNNTLGSTAEAGQDNFIYVRVRNRGGTEATDVEAHVYWSPPATMITPDLWSLVGSVTIPTVPVGDVLIVSDAITWDAAGIPATGHYCFVGLVGNTQDPAPAPADFLVWNNFLRFIRENNNVTWRNFNVVDNIPNVFVNNLNLDVVTLPFIVPGPPDQARRMQLEVEARLPEGTQLWLEAPLHLLDDLRLRSPYERIDDDLGRLPINPYGRSLLGEALFPAMSRNHLQLLVNIPEDQRDHPYEVFVRQLYEGQEVGRITWRLVPPDH